MMGKTCLASLSLGGHEAELNHVEKAFGSQRRPLSLLRNLALVERRRELSGQLQDLDLIEQGHSFEEDPPREAFIKSSA